MSTDQPALETVAARRELIDALRRNEAAFSLSLSEPAIERLADHYAIILDNNDLLHLVAPCSADEFAVRHVLESLTLLRHLPASGKIADIGTGAGLPSLPCLLARDGLSAVLIETKEKKAKFLDEAVPRLGLSDRVEIVNRQFEEVDPHGIDFVTCRALDRFTDKLPRIVRWSGRRKMLLFGGPGLGEALQRLRVPFSAELMPMSIQRSLYVLGRS